MDLFRLIKVLVNALGRIDTSLTRQNFLTALKNTPNNILDGIYLKFYKTQLLNKIYLFHYENSKFIEVKR